LETIESGDEGADDAMPEIRQQEEIEANMDDDDEVHPANDMLTSRRVISVKY
jgi:hypothetical protein